MTNAALKYDGPLAESGPAEAGAGSDETADGESLFTAFVDEIDAWARHALAANGFGDPV